MEKQIFNHFKTHFERWSIFEYSHGNNNYILQDTLNVSVKASSEMLMWRDIVYNKLKGF